MRTRDIRRKRERASREYSHSARKDRQSNRRMGLRALYQSILDGTRKKPERIEKKAEQQIETIVKYLMAGCKFVYTGTGTKIYCYDWKPQRKRSTFYLKHYKEAYRIYRVYA